MAQLNWTFEALESLERISENLSGYSEKYAAYFVKTVFEKVEVLSDFPYIGRTESA